MLNIKRKCDRAEMVRLLSVEAIELGATISVDDMPGDRRVYFRAAIGESSATAIASGKAFAS
jgi:hypothetical protein